MTADNNFDYTVNKFRYDILKKQKIDHHFDGAPNLVVNDIFEDDSYYWYACYNDPTAINETTIKGNVAIIRKNKITNDLKLIKVEEGVFEHDLFITGDKSNIWLSQKNRSKLYKFNKNDLPYKTFYIEGLSGRVKENYYTYSENYLWLILSNGAKRSLYRFDKNDLSKIKVDIDNTKIMGFNSCTSDNGFIWVDLALNEFAYQPSATNNTPYLIKVSKDTMKTEEIPIETSLRDGINNMTRSFIRNVGLGFCWIFGIKF